MKIDFNQLDKKIIQENNKIFQTGILSSGELDISYLISQRHTYSSQRIERIYITHNSDLNFNPNKINNIVALAQNNSTNKSGISRTKRWQNRTRLEVLKRH
jgi:hypothetical protein